MKKLYLALLICIATYNVSKAQCSADFVASHNPICTGDSVYYTNLTTGIITTYAWNFGAGATPATFVGENPPTVAYSSPGTKTVTLQVQCFSPTPQNCVTVGAITVGPLSFGGVTTCTVGTATLSTSTRTGSVSVLAKPVPTITPSVLTACTNAPIDFAGTPANASSYSWNFGAGASPATSNEQNPKGIVYSTSGAKNVTLTVSNGACEGTVSQAITINPSPTSSFSSTAPACTGQNVDFTDTGNGTSSSWTFGSGSAPATSNTQTQTVTYSTSGVKTVTLVSTLGTCTATATGAVTIYQSPTATATAAPSTACTKAPVNFTGAAGAAGSWRYSWDLGSGASPSTSSAQNPTGVVYSTAGTKTITLTVYDLHCSSTTTITVTIKQTPTADFVSNAPQCTGIPVDFTNTGTTASATWAWDFGAGAAPPTSTTQDQAGVLYNTAGGKVVRLITTVNGCSDTIKKAIEIYQSPTASFDAPASVCTHVKMNFTNTGSTGANWKYSWDFGAGAEPWGSTAENPKGVYYNTAGTKTITLTIYDDHCSKTTTQTVVIKATPTADFSSTAPQCTGLPVDFVNLGTTGLTYAWNFDVGGAPVSAAPPTGATENPKGIIYSTAGNKVVQQIVTNSGTSCADTAVKSITIHQTPTATFTSNAPKCVNDSVRFTNTGSTGGSWTYFWDFGQDALPQTATSENPSGVAYLTGGTKTVTFTIFNGYCSKTATQTIVINSLPIAKAGRDTTICPNTTVQIGSATIAGNTYNWFAPVTLSSATISNPVATPVAHITEYIVTVKNANSCVNKDTVVVTMLDPIKAYAGVDEEICRYDSVQVGVGLVEQQIYKWTPSAGLSSTTIPNPVASPDSTTTYKVSVSYSGKPAVSCKTETDEVTITVHQLPLIEAGTVRHQPAWNDSIIVLDTITVGSSVQLIAIGGLQYHWTPSYALDNVGIFNPIATPDTTTTYAVTGIDIYGCINTDTVTITVIVPSVWVPTAFSPNGNGENDVFYVRGPGITNFELGIFNRWGEQIYYSKKQDQGWDGTRPIGGEELPAGAYLFYVKGKLTDGTVVDKKGLINLIR
jgi:gliding motility-associated-like protein